MAEGLAMHLGSDVLENYSSGTEEYIEVKPLAVKAMEGIGISMDSHYPKFSTEIPEKLIS